MAETRTKKKRGKKGDVLDRYGVSPELALDLLRDMLLYSTDYPHRQFSGSDPLPAGLPEEALPDILSGNALKAYPRLAAEPALREAAAILEETT